MNRFKTKTFEPLDAEERELMESIENEEWQSVSNLDSEKKKAAEAAKNTLRRDKRINLRLSRKDYSQIQVKAMEEGVPYQTLISSIAHKYLNGSLVARDQEKNDIYVTHADKQNAGASGQNAPGRISETHGADAA